MAVPVAGPGLPTPKEVLQRLVKAFGETKVGETGYNLAATRCLSEAEKAEARRQGSSLLYGEMLPDGVSKALDLKRLGQALGENSTILELGMGSGTVAMQMFLQCPSVRKVVGVEVVRSRYSIAEGALQRLAQEEPEQWRITDHVAGEKISLEGGGRVLQCHCADFFSLGLDLVRQCNVIFFAVNIPWKLFPKLSQRFTEVKEGCRLFTYHRLDTVWWTEEPCPFHQVEVNVPESDTFSTSWSPQGFRFYVYVCDRSRGASIKVDPRNETFSEWQVMWDEPSKCYFFHNQETESSQWEMPRTAGAWQVHWSEEYDAWFFVHGISGHSQWEAPKCLADLGWSWAYGTSAETQVF